MDDCWALIQRLTKRHDKEGTLNMKFFYLILTNI